MAREHRGKLRKLHEDFDEKAQRVGAYKGSLKFRGICWGLGFRGLEFRVLGYRLYLGFRRAGEKSNFRFEGLGFRVLDIRETSFNSVLGFRLYLGFRV